MAADFVRAPASFVDGGRAATHGLAAWFHGRPKWGALFLIAPAFVYLGALYVLPLAQVLLRSVFTPDFGLANYTHLFRTEVYWNSFAITFRISAIVALVCPALGYPVAVFLTRLSADWRVVAFALILVPYWTSALVRELCLELGDAGAQAARWFAVAASATPSVNLTPAMTIGN